jgi:hypothetical protein
MAPHKQNPLLELCTTSITLGNSVAVKLLEYLSAVTDPPNGFNKVATEFLAVSACIIPAKKGLTELVRASTQLPSDVNNELLEKFRQVHTSFTVLGQVTTKLLEKERKTGLGKRFKMMFADSEIEKLRLSLSQCREALQRNSRVQTWSLAENQIEPAAGIG